MRRVPCLLLLAVGLALAGCGTLGKKLPNAPQAKAGPRGPFDVAPPAGGALPPPAWHDPVGPTVPTARGNGMLAGQVIDSYNRRPPRTYIQVTYTPDPGERPAAPIEVAADDQGYFTIPGLQVGRHYQLTARAKNGDRVLAGSTWATPPNPKVLIRISEDLATNNTPPVPGPPVWNGQSAPTQPPPPPIWPDATNSTPNAGIGGQPWVPGNTTTPNAPREPLRPTPPASSRPAELRPPVRDNSAAPAPGPTQPAVVTHPDRIVNGPNQYAQGVPLRVPGQGPPMPGSEPKPVPTMIPNPGQRNGTVSPPGPAPVPSCSLTGRQLYNFALYDITGQAWEFRNRTGKLVLIDFWGTWCRPCLNAIPHVKALQERYGPYGLEVVGIAYENGTPQEQVEKVYRVRKQLSINYRVLMGSDRNRCPVLNQFGVASFPTLVLIDETGRIIWREEGLDYDQQRELEGLIRQRLGLR